MWVLIGFVVLPVLAYYWLKGNIFAALLAIVPWVLASVLMTEHWELNVIHNLTRIGGGNGAPMTIVFVCTWVIGQGLFIAILPMGYWQLDKEAKAEKAARKRAEIARIQAMVNH